MRSQIAALACALALSGCATIERHPYISGFVATSIAISAGKALRDHHESFRPTDIETPTVDCSTVSCR